MKLLFVLENYLPHIGGVEIVFKNICEGMAARGHKVTIVTHRLPNTEKEETVNGVRIVRIGCFDNRYLFTFFSIPTVLRLAKEADVIHTTTYNGAFPSWIASMFGRKPSLITVHETWLGRWRQLSNFSAPVAWMHEMFEWLIYKVPRFKKYVCVSNSTKKMLLDVLPGRKEKILTIHNGFDPKMWKKRHPTKIKRLRKELEIEKSWVIFASGRPGTTKGFEYLVTAFWHIQENIPNAKLVLMLSNDKQYRHKVELFKTRANPNTIFVESQPFKELPAWRQMADCIVVPSVTEGFGYVALESVASGVPVVASDTTSIPEVIYGKHVLVEPQNPTAIVEGVQAVYEKKYKKTKEKKFPWKDSLDKYERLYKELVS